MRQSPTAHRWRDAGFTLIEVLVVVAIIALLIAILLPSLSHAREQSKAVVCRHNLQQVGYGGVQYANEMREYLPPTDPADEDVLDTSGTYYVLGNDNMGVYFPKWGADLKLWACPGAGNQVRKDDLENLSSTGEPGPTTSLTGPNGFVDDLELSYGAAGQNRRGMAYEYIPFIYDVIYRPDERPLVYKLSRTPNVRMLRMHRVKTPATVAILHDCDDPDENWSIADPGDPHYSLKGGNMAFADGHADWIPAGADSAIWVDWSDKGRPRVRR